MKRIFSCLHWTRDSSCKRFLIYQMLGALLIGTALTASGVHQAKPGSRSTNSLTTAFIETHLTEPAGESVKLAFLEKPGNTLPSLSELESLKPENEAALREEFFRAGITNKVRAAWGLAHLGGPGALEVLKEPFEKDYQNRMLSIDEEPALLLILKAIGYLGQRSDEAYDYLRASLSSDVWRKRIRWQQEPGYVAEAPVRYTGLSAMAFAMTGRPDAMKVITNLMAAEEQNVPRMASEIVTAVFFIDYINKNGKEALIRDTLTGNTFVAFESFTKTETGKAWNNWFRTHEGLPPLE